MGVLGNISAGFGFTNGKEYVEAGFYNQDDKALTYPRMIRQRVFRTKNVEEMAAEAKKASGGAELKKTLGALDLTALGVGFMCGAGIFVSPGYIASALTGPALFVAYLVAAVSAYLSSLCYAEFTSAVPLAGAAYNYVYSTLGEFIAWITVFNLLLEYIMANAAAVRGFSPYLALLCNKPANYFIRSWNGYNLDGFAAGVTIVATIILSWGIQESATANLVITAFHVLIMLFIVIAGLTKANKANFSPFIKQGSSWKNIFNGAAIAFFSFIGFDALATTAEEVNDVKRDMPRGIIGSVSIVTIIYSMMCVTLTLMVPTPDIDPNAAFASAFDYVGMGWAKYIVSIGALLGIFTTTLIGVLGASRILVGCCRERMLPPFFAVVGGKRQTPWVATWTIGLCSAGIALFSDFANLANMLSIGTLLVFWVVAVALLWLRSYVPGRTTTKGMCVLLVHIFAVIGFSLGFTLCWVLPVFADAVPADSDSGAPAVPAGEWNSDQWKWLVAMACCFFASVASFRIFVPQDFVPPGFTVPIWPLIPCGSVFVNTFLMGQLDVQSYERFGYSTIAAIAVYLVYGAVAQQAHDNRLDLLAHALPESKDCSAGPRDQELSKAAKVSGASCQLTDTTCSSHDDSTDVSSDRDSVTAPAETRSE